MWTGWDDMVHYAVGVTDRFDVVARRGMVTDECVAYSGWCMYRGIFSSCSPSPSFRQLLRDISLSVSSSCSFVTLCAIRGRVQCGRCLWCWWLEDMKEGEEEGEERRRRRRGEEEEEEEEEEGGEGEHSMLLALPSILCSGCVSITGLMSLPCMSAFLPSMPSARDLHRFHACIVCCLWCILFLLFFACPSLCCVQPSRNARTCVPGFRLWERHGSRWAFRSAPRCCPKRRQTGALPFCRADITYAPLSRRQLQSAHSR